jgi:hypothetical protein
MRPAALPIGSLSYALFLPDRHLIGPAKTLFYPTVSDISTRCISPPGGMGDERLQGAGRTWMQVRE